MKHRYLLFLALGLRIFTLSASAKVSTATVYATATGSTGAVIPGASVALYHACAAAFGYLRIGHYSTGIECQIPELTTQQRSAGNSRFQRVRAESRLSRRAQ